MKFRNNLQNLNHNFDGFDVIAERCLDLKTLKLSNNKIKDFELNQDGTDANANYTHRPAASFTFMEIAA